MINATRTARGGRGHFKASNNMTGSNCHCHGANQLTNGILLVLVLLSKLNGKGATHIRLLLSRGLRNPGCRQEGRDGWIAICVYAVSLETRLGWEGSTGRLLGLSGDHLYLTQCSLQQKLSISGIVSSTVAYSPPSRSLIFLAGNTYHSSAVEVSSGIIFTLLLWKDPAQLKLLNRC